MTPKEVRAKWVAALRSGEYKQTKSYLHDEQGYCCLGVLCDLAVKDGLIAEPRKLSDNRFLYDRTNGTNVDNHGDVGYAVLPRKIREWAGLCSNNGAFVDDKGWYDNHCLSAINDRGGDFSKI